MIRARNYKKRSRHMEWIDLRSDTVTKPTPAMREAMLRAEVGDDVYGEDPTVNALQERLAADLGFEAGLFLPSGTQSNLVALLAHCARGDEYIVGNDAHTYKFEGGGAAVLGSIQPQPIVQAEDGTLPLDVVERAIKPVDPHFARTKLLCLENTWHGRVLPLRYLLDARALCDRRGNTWPKRARCAIAAGWVCTSTAPACTTRRWPAAWRRARSRGISTACRCACRRDSARRWARCWWDRAR